MSILPNIEVTIVEYLEDEHNKLHGIDKGQQMNLDVLPNTSEKAKTQDGGKKGEGGKEQKYYLVTCKDNGCGIVAEQVGEMLGRVLSGSKHGVRQTRGKYGLGAKMVRQIISP